MAVAAATASSSELLATWIAGKQACKGQQHLSQLAITVTSLWVGVGWQELSCTLSWWWLLAACSCETTPERR
jgi:hypothetical protein